MEDNDEIIKKYVDKYYELWFGINSFYSKWAKMHETTDCALFTLQVIFYHKDDCTLKLICDKLVLPKQTVASILDNLESKKYICKKINPNDKRHKFITFTKKGLLYAKPILDELEKTEIEIFKSISKDKIESFLNINSELLKFMKHYVDK